MKRKPRRPPSSSRQPHAGRAMRPTYCANCQTLYDEVHADVRAANQALGPTLGLALDPAVVYAALRQPMPCLLCERPETCHGALCLPPPGLGVGGALLYFLCPRCLALPTATRALRVEATIMAGLVGHTN